MENAWQVMHLHGQAGHAADRARALRLFGRAAEQGFAPAHNGMGFQYLNGLHVVHPPNATSNVSTTEVLVAKNATKAFEHFNVKRGTPGS